MLNLYPQTPEVPWVFSVRFASLEADEQLDAATWTEYIWGAGCEMELSKCPIINTEYGCVTPGAFSEKSWPCEERSRVDRAGTSSSPPTVHRAFIIPSSQAAVPGQRDEWQRSSKLCGLWRFVKEHLLDVDFDFLVWSMSHLLTWRSKVYGLCCSQPPGGN